jgi:transposase-like protein
MEAEKVTKKRKQYTSTEKMAILRQHLLEGTPVSDVCDEHDLQPTVFYRWQKQLFEQGAVVFERQRDTEKNRLKCQVEHLEGKVRKKDEVLGELMEEYVTLKKELGAP